MAVLGRTMALREWEKLEDPPGRRLELLHGRVGMNPAPRPMHQHVVGMLMQAFAAACGPRYLAVFDIEWRVPGDDPDALLHAPRPDVTVARRAALRRVSGLTEPPLLVVEVLSPGNRKAGIDTKRRVYYEHGAGHYVEVSITDDERSVIVTWYERGPSSWTQIARAEGDEVLAVGTPFPLTIRPNDLLF